MITNIIVFIREQPLINISWLFTRFSSYYEKILARGEVKCIDDELPFTLPDSWSWCRLIDVGITETGTTPSKTHPEYFGDYIPFLGPANILEDKVISVTQGLSEIGMGFGRVIPSGSILQVCIGGSIGKCAIVNREVTFNQQINSITPIECNIEYVHYVLQSETFRLSIMEKATGTATPIINRGNWERLLFPLPPTSEQERIVVKLHELTEYLLRYTNAQSSLDDFNTAINIRLRKSILQEAIQGKLVPQDTSEEPVSVLLQRIKEEKLRLVKEGKLKKKDVVDSVIYKGDDNKYYEQIDGKVDDITEDIPFDVPDGWSWCRLKSICTIFTGATFKKEDARTDKQGIRILRGGNILPFEITFKADDIFLPFNFVKEKILLQKNDIVTPAVTSLENIGKMARVKDDLPDVTVGGFVFVLRLYYSNDWFSQYLLALMSSPTIIEYMKSITNKSGQAFYNIGKERLATTLLPIPPLNEQQRIVSQIEKIFSEIKGN